jgi:hypothetical protein
MRQSIEILDITCLSGRVTERDLKVHFPRRERFTFTMPSHFEKIIVFFTDTVKEEDSMDTQHIGTILLSKNSLDGVRLTVVSGIIDVYGRED